MIIPDYVGQMQTAAPFILAALVVAVVTLIAEHLTKPKRLRF